MAGLRAGVLPDDALRADVARALADAEAFAVADWDEQCRDCSALARNMLLFVSLGSGEVVGRASATFSILT